jgi:hypothetical protein
MNENRPHRTISAPKRAFARLWSMAMINLLSPTKPI